jgi:hypothetical protein
MKDQQNNKPSAKNKTKKMSKASEKNLLWLKNQLKDSKVVVGLKDGTQLTLAEVVDRLTPSEVNKLIEDIEALDKLPADQFNKLAGALGTTKKIIPKDTKTGAK